MATRKRAKRRGGRSNKKRMDALHKELKVNHILEGNHALKRFAKLKAGIRNVNEEELRYAVSLLHEFSVLSLYQSQLTLVMPEMYCILSELSKDSISIAKRLPFIFERVLDAKNSLKSRKEQEAHRQFQLASIVAARMMQNDMPISLTKDLAVFYAIQYLGRDRTPSYHLKIYHLLLDRWHPNYICILPQSVQVNILSRLDMKSFMRYLRTCRSIRLTMLEALKWRLTDSSTLAMNIKPLLSFKKFSIEVIINTISFLDSSNLQTCTKICRAWRNVLLNDSRVWTTNVKLTGDPQSVDIQWNRIQQLSKGYPAIGPNIEDRKSFTSEECLIKKCQELKTPSIPSLQLFSYTTEHHFELGRLLWENLTRCTLLKVLRYKIKKGGSCCKVVLKIFKLANQKVNH